MLFVSEIEIHFKETIFHTVFETLMRSVYIIQTSLSSSNRGGPTRDISAQALLATHDGVVV
jgi:hypothetical protein